MSTPKDPTLNSENIVDHLYDIALDTESLDTFIDTWNTAGLDAEDARLRISQIHSFDDSFKAHLDRAHMFLLRDDGSSERALHETLAPFASSAALIVDRSLRVVACNEGAETSFELAMGSDLSRIPLTPAARELFDEALRQLTGAETRSDRLLNLELTGASSPTLFHMRQVPEASDNLVLIVTTKYHWRAALGQTLEEVFQLTAAEQGVVRALVEGQDVKSIAADRGTSEGTVRSQIKSILAKMNARSQSEVIRLVLSLRDVMGSAGDQQVEPGSPAPMVSQDWLEAEVWKPFKSLNLPDGRTLYYSDMGPITGAPVLYSHVGFALARWTRDMLKYAFKHGLRVICPIRAGYGPSDPPDPKADILAVTRADTLALLAHLGIEKLPYMTQGSDVIFSIDLADHHPEVVTEIIGICARPTLPGDAHYATMGKWHRFFMSTARHSPQLLHFTAKALFALANRIGGVEMSLRTNRGSPTDCALVEDPHTLAVLTANSKLVTTNSTNTALVYSMEMLVAEAEWWPRMEVTQRVPTKFYNGIEDPSVDVVTIAQFREHFPWLDIEVVPDSGQFLIFQKYADLIPKIAAAAHAARG